MEEDFRKLGIGRTRDLNRIKKAYYKKVKEYPPEDHGDEFIIINNAYRNIMSNFEEDKIKIIVENLRDNEESRKALYKSFREYVGYVDNWNFTSMNREIVNLVMALKKKEYLGEALYLAYIAEVKFGKLQLYGLADAYRKLEEYITGVV